MTLTLRPTSISLLLVAILALAGCVDEPHGAPHHLEAYLNTQAFPKLVIEVDHVEGAEPSAFALDALASAMRNATGRSDVEIVRSQTLPRGDETRVWSQQELEDFAKANRDLLPPGVFGREGTSIIHLLYLQGESEVDGARAVALRGTIVIFDGMGVRSPMALPSIHAGPTMGDMVERSVLVHEAGHVIGLVNNGLPMVRPHEDPQDRHHSANSASVMWRAVDSFDAQRAYFLGDEPPPFEFDADDFADIRGYQQRWSR